MLLVGLIVSGNYLQSSTAASQRRSPETSLVVSLVRFPHFIHIHVCIFPSNRTALFFRLAAGYIPTHGWSTAVSGESQRGGMIVAGKSVSFLMHRVFLTDLLAYRDVSVEH